MTRAELAGVAALVDAARELYGDDPATAEMLDAYAERLREPLRLAVAGMVKAGKSTLLNALIGEQIAPTDAGECTRVITWYRHSHTPRITLRLQDGTSERMPIHRSHGRLVLDMGERTAADVASIDVEWPSESLRSLVLIDTPGIASLTADASARSTAFLTPSDAPSAADAIVYLLRHVHAADLNFLEAFRDTAAGTSQTVNALAVLSRADEIGAGRIDSLLSAARIAQRYRRDGELQALALDVLPVAGLVAESGSTLHESEFEAFRELAALDHAVRERLLLSVDRFLQPSPVVSLTADERRALLARFGIFGVRLGAALVRTGAASSTDLAERLVQRSGLVEVQRFITFQFRARSAALKSRGILQGLDMLVRERGRPGDADLRRGIERAIARTHELRELSLLADLRTSTPDLPPDDIAAAERIVGGEGVDAFARLDLPDTASRAQVRARTDELVAHWRALAQSPLTTRATADQCRVVIRSLEGIGSETAADRPLGAAPDVVAAGGPAQGAR